MPRILPHVIYDDVGAAIEWLTRVFGFRERTWVRHTAADGVIAGTQVDVMDAVITFGQPSVHGGSPRSGVSMTLYVSIVGRPHLSSDDLGGHQWTFAEHVEEVDSIQSHFDE